MKTNWRHDELAVDLAKHIRAGGDRLTWTNIAIEGMNGARPDVFAMRLWGYANPELVSYEVKVSVADFRSDITSGKWMKYLKVSQGVTFAAPHGMITVKDIPDGCGLILRSERGWRHVRKPKLRPATPIPMAVWVKLVSCRPNAALWSYGGSEDAEQQRRRKEFERALHRRVMKKIGKKYGEQIARYMAAPEEAKQTIDAAEKRAAEIIERAKEQAEQLKDESEAAWGEIARFLAIPPETTPYHRRQALRMRLQLLSQSETGRELNRIANGLRKLLADSSLLSDLAKGVAE